MKNWKTTISGLMFAASLFLGASGLPVPVWASRVLKGLEAVSVGCLGASAKDFNVDQKPEAK